MGKASRIKRRALKSRGRVRRGSGSYGFYGALAAVIVVGTALVAVSKASESSANDKPRANEDHWHAAIGVNVCGTWLPNAPEYHNRADNSSLQAGIHSHGDGLMHIHPYSGDEAGKRATVGRFMEFGGWKVDTDTIEVWDETKHEDGDTCGEGDAAKEAVVRWTVDGEEQRGNPGSYRPIDGVVIGIYFVSEDEDLEALGAVPGEANLANPVDETTVPTDSTPPIDPTDLSTDPSAATTTVAGTGSSTSAPGASTAPTTATNADTTTTAAPPADPSTSAP